MNRKIPNLFLGCVVAPLAAPLIMLLTILVVGEDLRGPAYKYGLNDAKEMFGIVGMFLVLGAPIAYAITIVAGLPFYFITKKLGLINFWSITFLVLHSLQYYQSWLCRRRTVLFFTKNQKKARSCSIWHLLFVVM